MQPGNTDLDQSPSQSQTAPRAGRPVSPLGSLACTSNSATSLRQTPCRCGVRLQYN